MNLPCPKNISPRHAEAVDALCKALVNDPEIRPLVSLVVGGSVARGTASGDSDVDVFVTFGGDWCQRRRELIADVPVDIFIDPVMQAEHLINSGLNDVMIENYATGWIVLDPSGFAQRMKNVSRSLMARPRRAPSEGEVYMLCERAEDRFKALSSSQADKIAFTLVSGVFIAEAVEAFYVLHRAWRPQLKLLPGDFRRRDFPFYEDLSKLHSDELTFTEKIAAGRRVTDKIVHAGQSLGYKAGNGPKTFMRPGPNVTLRVGDRAVTIQKPS